mmetsp:Transcript_29267/g.69676  ORF Transcript_29267/g.69676 Transcript_29267/m.69676 type:complete len:165 (+) Transcript_29267:1625-2119(+)
MCLLFGKLVVGLFFSVTFRIVMQAPDAKAQYAECQGKASPWILPPNRKNVPATIIKTDKSMSSDRSRTPVEKNLAAVISMRVSIGSSNLIIWTRLAPPKANPRFVKNVPTACRAPGAQNDSISDDCGNLWRKQMATMLPKNSSRHDSTSDVPTIDVCSRHSPPG